MDDFIIKQGLLVGAAAATGLSIIALGILSAFMPALAPQLPTLVGGLVTTFGIMAGGDATHKWIAGKATPDAPDAPQQPVEPLPPQ